MSVIDESGLTGYGPLERIKEPPVVEPLVMTDYQRQVVESAEKNHIWINAFACIRPTDELLMQIGRQVLEMLDRKDNLIYPWQDSESEHMRAIGRLTPELVLRVNKS